MIDEKEILSSAMITVVEDSIKATWEKVKKFFKDLDSKESIRYRTAYQNYLINTENRYGRIKTIIHRHVPKNIYDFYECVGVRYNGEMYATRTINDILKIGHRILITGTGGLGKSMLFKHFYLNTIQETDYIPVLIELRSYNNFEIKDISIYQSIYKTLCDNGFDLSEEYFEYSMKEGAYILFFDGFDEINRDKTQKITSEIKNLSSKYNENRYFISSRPQDSFIGWNDFCEAHIQPLTKDQALSLIKKIDFDETTKQKFYKELDDKLYNKYRSFASNPLLLNIMLLTFQKHASIPEKLNDFYEEAFVTLFNVHDATKDAYVRDIRSGLGCEDFKQVFSYICFKSYFAGVYQFSESEIRSYIQRAQTKIERIKFPIDGFLEDLTTSVCMLVKDGNEYCFSHRSFQEYFAAWYTCKLLDDEQRRLLHSWIRESHNATIDSYFTMLFDLQSDKVNKLILCPILEEIRKHYNDKGYSIEFLSIMFSGMNIRKKEKEDGNTVYEDSLEIMNTYLCRGLTLSLRLNNYPFEASNFCVDESIWNRAVNYHKSHKIKNGYYRDTLHIKFETALKIYKDTEILEMFEWIKEHLDFVFNIIDKYDEKSSNRKRKLSSILEDF